jgi:hypothetical protein
LMGARQRPHCVGLGLALIIVIKFLGGGVRPAGFGKP